MKRWYVVPVSAVLRVAAGFFVNVAYIVDNMSVALRDWGSYHLSPADVLSEIQRWNQIQGAAAKLRKPFIRHSVKPEVVFVHCMDARFNARETLAGCFGNCFDIGTPGGVLPEAILQGIKAVVVERGVKVVIFSEHRDCLAKKVVKTVEGRYPELRKELNELDHRRAQFVSDPEIASLIDQRKLIVVSAHQDSQCQKLMFVEKLELPKAA